MTRSRVVAVVFVISFFVSGATLVRGAANSPATRLHGLFDAYFEELLERDSVFATSIGDERYNDRLENFLSPAHREEERRFRERWLAAIRAIDRGALSGQDVRSYDIFVLVQERELAGLRFPRHLLPISQLFGVPSQFARLGSGDGDHPFRNEKDYRDFLSRIDGWVVVAGQIVANLREGIARGVVQPRVLMERALPQLEQHLVNDPTESVFYQPLLELPETIGAKSAAALRMAYRLAITEKIVPSYRKIFEFVRDEYLPACRDTVGLSALPDGAAWYAHSVAAHATSQLSPAAIHEVGLVEVERIREAMRRIIAEVGFEGDLHGFLASLQGDRRFFANDAGVLLDRYRSLYEKVAARLPEVVDLPLEAALEIREVPAFYAESAPTAIYDPAAPDGSRPGTFYVNTHAVETRPLYQSEALFLHEALPGHHLQASIARGVEELPRFRRFVEVNAYIEGWGLYSESLGAELGLYQDPYSRFGRLDNEMLRAARLVVDTGIHARGWSRTQSIDYLESLTSLSQGEIAAEVERYIAWPGQALSYKLGELTLQRLRRTAEERLGEHFDLRAFHRKILEDGVLPLPVLERKIDDWLAVAAQATGTGSTNPRERLSQEVRCRRRVSYKSDELFGPPPGELGSPSECVTEPEMVARRAEAGCRNNRLPRS
jgi:uncharacterized protein (DUF885 family)